MDGETFARSRWSSGGSIERVVLVSAQTVLPYALAERNFVLQSVLPAYLLNPLASQCRAFGRLTSPTIPELESERTASEPTLFPSLSTTGPVRIHNAPARPIVLAKTHPNPVNAAASRDAAKAAEDAKKQAAATASIKAAVKEATVVSTPAPLLVAAIEERTKDVSLLEAIQRLEKKIDDLERKTLGTK